MKYIKRKYRRFITGISNLIYYFKVIWKDEQWDFMFIDELHLAKYKRAYAHYISDDNNTCKTWEPYIKSRQAFKICVDILERRCTDWYAGPISDKDFKLIDTLNERDWKIYCKLIQKHQQSWWD